jgi:hypothetical protein
MTSDRADILHRLPQYYDTGWINRSDWTNVHLGSNATKNVDSNVNHNFGVPLNKLIVKVLISTDGTDANSFEIGMVEYGSGGSGANYTPYYIDDNNIKIQTGIVGLCYNNDVGNIVVIDAEDWYYKIVVMRMFA